MRKLLLVLALLVTGCDQWTKHLARTHLDAPRELLGGTVVLWRAENRGAFLSWGSDLPDGVRIALLTAGVAVLVVAAIVGMFKSVELTSGIALALIVGGGAGNLVDRVMRGGFVTDFLFVRAGPLHTGIFNVADVAVMIGVGLLLLGAANRGNASEEQRVTRP